MDEEEVMVKEEKEGEDMEEKKEEREREEREAEVRSRLLYMERSRRMPRIESFTSSIG